jgi:ketosteroid isomerase-like protein
MWREIRLVRPRACRTCATSGASTMSYPFRVMTESTPTATTAAVLSANALFYRAFTDGDYAAMCDLWAEQAQVACLHPGARTLVGRGAVLESWKQILGGTSRFELRCRQPIVQVAGDAAIVTCYEASDDEPAHLAATNVFVMEDGRWRMVHHHAGPLSSPVPRSPDPASLN